MQNYQKHPTEATRNSEGVWITSEWMFILQDGNALEFKIIIIGHYGSAGHGGKGATKKVGSEKHWWKEIKRELCGESAQSCIHFIISRTSGKIVRPLATALHVPKPYKFMLTEFLYMGNSSMQGCKYVLVARTILAHTLGNKNVKTQGKTCSRVFIA